MNKVLAIVGPTGIGKTKLSIQCAKRWHGQVISADSMQVYQKMDIGTAKVTPKEQQGIPHYLVDAQSYDQPYNVKIFRINVAKPLRILSKHIVYPLFVVVQAST